MSIAAAASSNEPLETARRILAKGMAITARSLYCICFDRNTFIDCGAVDESAAIAPGTLDELKVRFAELAETASAPASKTALAAFLDLDTLQERLTSKQIIQIDFRNSRGTRSSARFVATDKHPDGTPTEALFLLETTSEATQASAVDTAGDTLQETLRDPLTNLFNRAGYERLTAEAAGKTNPIAYAILDVDNLESINANYGYRTGDDVLMQVADVLRSLIRKGDSAARVSEDEFAVILDDCPISASQQVIAKFDAAHRALSEALPDGKPVTLSVGACFSPTGLNSETLLHADNAMRDIKADGRGGCAFTDETGTVFQKWFDHDVDHRHSATFANTVGSWRIEMPSDGSPRRMFCDDSMLRIAGEKRRVSPEEIYRHWRGGLRTVDEKSIDSELQRISENGELSHVAFRWNSDEGDLLPIVSSIARDRDFLDGTCYYGYFDLSRSGSAHKRANEIEMLNEALARSLVFGYVLDLEDGTYTTLRRPVTGPLSFIKTDGPTVSLTNALKRFIADEEGQKAIANMLDRPTMPSRLAGIDHVFCDFLSTGVQGWCRAKLYTFKAGGFLGLEKVILVGESIEVAQAERYDEPFALSESRTGTKAGRILVVDDEELNRVILEDALSDSFEVIGARDGAEAYELVKHHPASFAGIVTDLSMPNMNGEELLERLQKDGITEEVPVVVVTAEDKAEAENRCLTYGAIDFIRKPFHPPIARKRVINVVNLFNLQNHLKVEVEHRTDELQNAYDELEDKSKWLREYAFRLSETSARMIESLGEIVEFRSVEAGTHVARVKHYTHALAEHLMETNPECGLTEELVNLITDASPLHDVGKIAIPDAVLPKPGKLTDEEFETMKSHTSLGYKLLASLDISWQEGYRSMCEEICLCHHERYDGKGYPNGLKGEEIPLSAQIVSVADVFDALSSDRVYRPALSHQETYDLIMQGKVGSFSERILRCFDETFPQLVEISGQISSEQL